MTAARAAWYGSSSMGVADWLPRGQWLCFTSRHTKTKRAFRRSGAVVLVHREDPGRPPRLTEHRFADERAADAFFARLHRTEVHYKNLRRDERLEARFRPAIAAKPAPTREPRAPAKKRPAPRRARLRARDVAARAYGGDARAIARGVEGLVARLRAAGARVRARLGKPASRSALARLERALGAVPPSLAAIASARDGFDVRWSLDGVDVTFTWLSIAAALAARRVAARSGDETRAALVPLVRQYDGAVVGLDPRAPRGGELRVVFLDRLADAPIGIASSAGAFLEAVTKAAFTHPGIPDVANAAAAKVARRLRSSR